MATVKDTIDVNVPAALAYSYWLKFEDFPKFMDDVEEVKKFDDKHMHWKAKVAGKKEEWDAEVTDTIPERRIAWRSTSGIKNNGTVEFEPVSDTITRVALELDYEPHGLVEKAGGMLGIDKRAVHKDLENFKKLIEKPV
ncbi:MAG: SRPBCC family protein [Thiohalomonadaceae bacterium]